MASCVVRCMLMWPFLPEPRSIPHADHDSNLWFEAWKSCRSRCLCSDVEQHDWGLFTVWQTDWGWHIWMNVVITSTTTYSSLFKCFNQNGTERGCCCCACTPAAPLWWICDVCEAEIRRFIQFESNTQYSIISEWMLSVIPLQLRSLCSLAAYSRFPLQCFLPHPRI